METLLGRNAVCEAIRANRRRIQRVLIAKGSMVKGTLAEIVSLCKARHIPIADASKKELDSVGGKTRHQGVAAQVSAYPYVQVEDILAAGQSSGDPAFCLALDDVQDPQNVGTLFRTAEAVGVHGVLLPTRRAAAVTETVCRASAGAVEHLQIARVKNLVRALEELKSAGLWTVGVEQHERATDYRDVDLGMPLALVLGSEGRGMRRLVAEHCDLLIEIPMRGKINSLNVAIAGSVALYQVLSSRSKG